MMTPKPYNIQLYSRSTMSIRARHTGQLLPIPDKVFAHESQNLSCPHGTNAMLERGAWSDHAHVAAIWRRLTCGTSTAPLGFSSAMWLTQLRMSPNFVRSRRCHCDRRRPVATRQCQRQRITLYIPAECGWGCAPKIWNSLPLNCRTAPSVNTFKIRLKTFLFDST